jgi:ubiquinone/menaquinone biosynthesis C-methylase UbiE
METAEELKAIVKEKYSEIANQSKAQNESSCCGTGCCDTVDYTIFAEDYTKQEGYNPDADLGLGCGIPTEFAKIKEGETVLDLGSGAGNDAFIARKLVGEKGKVIGIDMTEAMIEKANANKEKLGFSNIEFVLGDIENMPVEGDSVDVILSNCVLNLVPDKRKAFAEMYRVLKPGGRFSVSDIVSKGEIPAEVRKAADMYAGCVSGAIDKELYMSIMNDTGFVNAEIKKEKAVSIPDDILLEYLSRSEIRKLKESGYGSFSVTVYGEKPL